MTICNNKKCSLGECEQPETCKAYVPVITNADRIRAMSDEELAWELMLWRCEAVARHHGISSEYPDTQKTILEWLQQPAKGGENNA